MSERTDNDSAPGMELQIAQWQVLGRGERYIWRQLRKQGFDDEAIASAMEEFMDDEALDRSDLWGIYRVVGVVMLVAGIAGNIWTIVFIRGWVIVTGIFMVLTLFGLFIVVLPQSLDIVIKRLKEEDAPLKRRGAHTPRLESKMRRKKH